MGMSSVTRILSDEGVGFDMSHLPEEYSIRGTLIHTYAYNRMFGCELPQIKEEWKGFAEAVDRFQDRVNPTPIAHEGEYLAEKSLIHPLMGFEGHPDLPAMDGVIPTVYDYKTGSIPLYTGPQLAGYALLLKRILPHIKEWARVGVLLLPDGQFRLKTYEDKRDFAEFLKAYHGYMERRGFKWSYR